jgi:hypothetical protein
LVLRLTSLAGADTGEWLPIADETNPADQPSLRFLAERRGIHLAAVVVATPPLRLICRQA